MSVNDGSDVHSINSGPLHVGQQLNEGRYTVQRPLAQGGMGTIYLATDHTAFERTVVVKVRDQSLDGDQDQFLEEARMLASLTHPAIPQILAYFQDGLQRCIVMEYIEGCDLQRRLTGIDERSSQMINGQPYPLADVLRWGVELCRVLEYLASRPTPVVHYDIKPANLVLDAHSGALFLVDFGTAQTRLAHAHGSISHAASLYGTPGYAPPEQYRGEGDPRSDVYALAATLYHLATDDDPSEHPFLFPHLERIGALGRVLAAALHKEPQQRSLAVTLRRQLQQLQLLVKAQDIIVPDGTTVAEASELIAWCEQHYEAALAWLYGEPIPQTPPVADQLEHSWARADLARSIRARLAQHRAEPAAGLDAVLALIAPQSYGSLRPQLAASVALVDFDSLQASSPIERTLTISNIGRRFVRAQVQLPLWVALIDHSNATSIGAAEPPAGFGCGSRYVPADQPAGGFHRFWSHADHSATVVLAPGEQIDLTLAAYVPENRFDSEQLRDTLVISDGAATLVQIQLEATTAPLTVVGTRVVNSRRTLAQTRARLPRWFWWMIVIALLVVIAIIMLASAAM